jgi:hypothetical protein
MRAPVSYVTPATQADRFADERPRSSRARARPSASSFSVSGPASASHAATPRRPASRRRRREAVSVIQALKVEPDSVAASSIALANSGGNDTDRLSRCAIDRMVVQSVGHSTRAQPAHQPRSRASPELTRFDSASPILDQLPDMIPGLLVQTLSHPPRAFVLITFDQFSAQFPRPFVRPVRGSRSRRMTPETSLGAVLIRSSRGSILTFDIRDCPAPLRGDP